MVGHNWGAQHAERWIWLHGITEDGDWLDAASGGSGSAGSYTPWVGNGALSIAGDRYALRRVRVNEYPGHCTFTLSGKGIEVRGTVEAPHERFVGWVYADPDGSEHHSLNCSIADMRLSVSRGRRTGRGARRGRRGGVRARPARARPRDRGPAVSRRMRASAEIVIERPREAVWEWASDPRHWHRWEERLSDVRVEDYEITENTPPRRQVVRAMSGRFPFEGTLELSEDVMGTRVRQTVDAGPEDALARFVFVVARPLVRRSMRRRIEAQLARLKTMVELEAAL